VSATKRTTMARRVARGIYTALLIFWLLTMFFLASELIQAWRWWLYR